MSLARVHNFSISLDGFATGEGLSLEAPFGHAGGLLHEWMFATQYGAELFGSARGSQGVDNAFALGHNRSIGAEIMGRGKFSPTLGPWEGLGTEDEWRGWWGPNPPFHTPVYVMTHFPRPSLEMESGTVFHFVDATPAEVLDLAKQAAGELDVRIGGGPTIVREFLQADLIDSMHIVQVPILLGRGTSLWEGLEGLHERFEIEAVSSPSGVTHLSFDRR